MQNKIYVGGLSWGTNDEGFREAFSSFGTIEEAKVIMDRDSGRSRGFGFITFSSDEEADKALSMNGTELDGRELKVNIAQDKPRRGGGGGGGGGGRRW